MSTRPELADPSLLREAIYIAGEWVYADGGATMEIYNPATGRLIGAVPAMSATETRRAPSRPRTRPFRCGGRSSPRIAQRSSAGWRI